VELHDPVDHGQADAAAGVLGGEIQIENLAEIFGGMPTPVSSTSISTRRRAAARQESQRAAVGPSPDTRSAPG
jgi:hypothetical protein